jgi:hypothetical protein
MAYYGMPYAAPPAKEGISAGSAIGLFFAFVVVGVIILIWANWSDISKGIKNTINPPQQYVPPTATQVAEYQKQLASPQVGLETVRILTNENIDVNKYSLLLCPDIELKGWDAEGKAQSLEKPNNADGSVNYIYMEDYMFMPDATINGLNWTEQDGSKKVKFATVSGGEKKYFFKSFDAIHGTIMMITTLDVLGKPVNSGFMFEAKKCRDIVKLLDDYPELRGGNNGIWWDRNIEGMTWYICALNLKNFKIQLSNKFNACLDQAAGIDFSDRSGENHTLGLHYGDGTRVVGDRTWDGAVDKNMATGRWIYDEACHPVIDPLTGKQAYKAGQGGWGYSCKQAYEFCGLDTGTVIGFEDWSQIDLYSKHDTKYKDNLASYPAAADGIVYGIGISEFPGSRALTGDEVQAAPLSQLGWVPSTEAAITIDPIVLQAAMEGSPSVAPPPASTAQ